MDDMKRAVDLITATISLVASIISLIVATKNDRK